MINHAHLSRVSLCDEIERLKRANEALVGKLRELQHYIDMMPPDLHQYGIEHRERVALEKVNAQWASRIVELETRCETCGLRVVTERK